jgi:hypothetical protein
VSVHGTGPGSAAYTDAVGDAFERLAGFGPEWGPGFAFHAPMAVEAMAALGHGAEVPRWLATNRQVRSYSSLPPAHSPLRGDLEPEWRAALGDFGRFTDWTRMFDVELAAAPWTDVVARWWPRLLPGLFGPLGHGMIRTAHAVRALDSVPAPTPALLHELAQGLAFWAARYWAPRVPGPGASELAALAAGPPPADVRAGVFAVAVTGARILADRAPNPTVPLIHMITIPAAVDLALPALPAELHAQSYRHAVAAAAATLAQFGAHLGAAPLVPAGAELPDLAACVGNAVDSGDEHAMKLADVCVRGVAEHPDDEPYRRAVTTVLRRFGGAPAR